MSDAIAKALRIAQKPICRADGGPASAADTRVSDGVYFGHGLLKSSGSGRTDTLPINVPSGAYVLPADIVSGLGQGNTFAGGKILDRIFADMHHEAQAQGVAGQQTAEHKGGRAQSKTGANVPIIAAGGEYIIHPDVVRHIGGGDMKAGHEWLDGFVKNVRTRTHKTLAKLPGPARD